jgi:hypothetical protein
LRDHTGFATAPSLLARVATFDGDVELTENENAAVFERFLAE